MGDGRQHVVRPEAIVLIWLDLAAFLVGTNAGLLVFLLCKLWCVQRCQILLEHLALQSLMHAHLPLWDAWAQANHMDYRMSVEVRRVNRE